MRILLFLLGLSLGTSLAAQNTLPAAALCAQGKKQLAARPPLAAQDTRSDSIDILSTWLFMDISDFTAQIITGKAVLSFTAKVDGVSEIRLDLLNMTIDGISSDLDPAWSYDGSVLTISWPAPLLAGENAEIQVLYHGKPVQDASGWGGFYWQGEYAYNLGVGFAADPHNYGRAWFPCFDNFTERCTFQFEIYTPAGRPAYCNGALAAEDPSPGGKVRRLWVMDQAIPSYLACVAVGPFTSFRREYPGEAGLIPVDIAVAVADSNKLKTSFQHLPDALAAFQYWYGPFRWNKVGYSIVPFNQGAMEHATNIAYMRSAVDGTTASETLMAHELSHHWWGDLATCSSAEDMWLNEGWAVYSEHLFLEQVYGPERFREVVEDNFLDVLEHTHVNEGGYRAVSGLPHDLTYGDHAYHKGAVVAHNLRGYLGDSMFRSGLRIALENNQFADWSSDGFRDKLSAATGYDLNDFFDDWVFQPGFTHFSVDSFQVLFSPVDAPTEVHAFVKQKLRGATHFYQNVPLEFTITDPFGNREYRSAMVSGENSTVQFTLPAWFIPAHLWVNTRQHITLARADKEHVVTSLSTYNFAPAKLNLKITKLPADSALIRVEHHYAMPDTAGNANPQGFRLSNRYWSIDALQNFEGEATLIYDGKGQLDQLDAELFSQTGPKEDSIVLLYRSGPGQPWLEHPNYTKNTVGSTQDRFGILRTLQTPPGEYAIAKGSGTTTTFEQTPNTITAAITPNPATDWIRIRADHPFERIRVVNSRGDLVREIDLPLTKETQITTASWPAGTYWFVLSGKGRSGVAGPMVR